MKMLFLNDAPEPYVELTSGRRGSMPLPPAYVAQPDGSIRLHVTGIENGLSSHERCEIAAFHANLWHSWAAEVGLEGFPVPTTPQTIESLRACWVEDPSLVVGVTNVGELRALLKGVPDDASLMLSIPAPKSETPCSFEDEYGPGTIDSLVQVIVGGPTGVTIVPGSRPWAVASGSP